MSKYLGSNTRIDHIAIAVKCLDEAVFLYQDIFGFKLQNKRAVSGSFSGMRSAEFDAGGFSIVLVQGTGPESQVSRYIEEYGPGVQHVAIEVEDVAMLTKTLETSGVEFATKLIQGDSLVQIFTQRESNTGMMIEFIQRVKNAQGFDPGNVQQLFEQLEENSAY